MIKYLLKIRIMKTLKLIIGILLIGHNFLHGQNPVLIPDTLSGNDFYLSLQNGTFQFYPDQVTNTMGVNGNILGPTLIMQKGDLVNLQVDNQLGEPTTIHWHGMHVSASNDGGPHTIIQPDEIWNPSFTVLDRAATYWYHPHLHEKTNEHVSKGIAGFIIVRDEDEGNLDLPRTYGVDDFPLVIQTKDFDENNQIVTPSNSDDVLMVNATIDPVLNVPSQVVRLRLLNGSSQRVFYLGFSENQIFYQIGSDDGLLSESNAVTRLRLAPGERVEILIDLDGMQGQSLSLMSYAAELPSGIYGATNPGLMTVMTLDGYNPNPLNGANYSIIQLNVINPTANPVTDIPIDLVEVNPIPESSADII
ncbi:MAG: bilirubin oxidase, partial [Bacteroidetes bacterium]